VFEFWKASLTESMGDVASVVGLNLTASWFPLSLCVSVVPFI
jgi:hypothetical protein